MLSYIFSPTPGQSFKYYTVALAIIAILIIGSFVFKTYYKNQVALRNIVFKKMFKKVPNRLVYFAIGLLFLLLVRYENIPYFAMRFWLFLVLLGLTAYLGYNLYKYFKVYPRERDNFESRPKTDTTKTQYLPNKRK